MLCTVAFGQQCSNLDHWVTCHPYAVQAVQGVFGYPKAELEGVNVSLLMPQPFSQRHSGYLQVCRQVHREHLQGCATVPGARGLSGFGDALAHSVRWCMVVSRMLS